MSWYDPNHSSWYGANAHVHHQQQQQQPAPAPGAPTAAQTRKTRKTALIICIILLVGCALYLALNLDVGSYVDEDGMPSDWQSYMEEIYGQDEYEPAKIDMPRVSDRGSLALTNAEGGQTLDFSDIYDKCVPSVVGIKVYEGDDDNKDYYAWGSGVIASKDGYIITNAHVIDGGSAAKVVLYDGSEYDAKLVGYDSSSDIALIKIDDTGLTAAEFASSSEVRVGDSVAAIGNPLSPELRLTMTRGIVSALNREMSYSGTTMSLIQTDASINEGNSGGPLFNDKGQVIGITNMKMISNFGSGIEGLGFAIPSDTVETIVNALVKDGAIYGRATIGVTIGPVSEEAAEHYDIPRGLYVVSVTKGSDAAKQGVKQGDIITKVNGQDVLTTSDVSDIKDGLDVGDTLTLTIWRNGKTFDVDVALTDPAQQNGD